MPNTTTPASALYWIAAGVLAALFFWQFSAVLLLVFASVLIAIMLLAIARLIRKLTKIGSGAALALSCLVILLVAAGFFLLLGTQIASESERLKEELPQLLSAIGNQLGIQHLDRRVVEWGQGLANHDGMMGRITATTSFLVSGLADALLVVVAGVYLAANPSTYRGGLIRLVPPKWRQEAAQFLDTSARALTLWLAGQLASMAAIGVLFAGGLLALGIPSALTLGFIAGVAEFIPYAGPILGGIPALLIAASLGRSEVLWVFGLYLAIQTVEGNVITPLVQRRAVDLPPVLTLAIVAIGGVFGFLGLLLATPLTVIAFIAVKQFYLRDTLKQKTSIPGESSTASR
jgi:predicted PurR-regulated permease PerM